MAPDEELPIVSRARRWLLRGGVLAALVIGAFLVYSVTLAPSAIMCDGSVPEWWIPDDYDNSGCVAVPPPWEFFYPWHWGEQPVYCLGLCHPDLSL